MRYITSLLCAAALVSTSQAQAAPKLTLDSSFLEITADNEGSHSTGYTYNVQVRARVFGDVEKGDVLKFVVKKGGKVLTKLRCQTHFFKHNSKIPDTTLQTKSRCTSKNAGLKVDGTLTVDAIYVRDSDESEHKLGSFDVQMVKYFKIVDFDSKNKKKIKRTPVFQVVPFDQMGLGYVWFKPWSGIKDAGQVYFYYWAPLTQHLADTDFRCMSGGKTVLRAANMGWEGVDKIRQHNEYGKKVKSEYDRTGFDHDWQKVVVKTSRKIAWGPGTASGWSKPEFVLKPGDYVCKFRSEGETVREFHFSIGPDYKPVLHPLQADGQIPMGPNRFLVDIRFPKNNEKEWCFPAKRMKQSVWFGRKWPASATKSLKALPPAVGDCLPE